MKPARNYRTVLLATLAVTLIASSAFADAGALSDQTINKIRSSFKMDTHTRAMYNSITNNDITSLAPMLFATQSLPLPGKHSQTSSPGNGPKCLLPHPQASCSRRASYKS